MDAPLMLPVEAVIDQELHRLDREMRRPGAEDFFGNLHKKVRLLDLLADEHLIPDEPEGV